MSFEIITGSHAGANDIIDALDSAWTFDSSVTTGESHSVVWGDCSLVRNGIDMSLRYNGVQPPNFASPTSAGGEYIIAKTDTALIVSFTNADKYNPSTFSIMIGTGTQVGGSTTSKIILLGGVSVRGATYPRTNCYCAVGGTGTRSRIDTEQTRLSSVATQITPYVHAEGGIACSDMALVDVVSIANFIGKVSVNDQEWYIAGPLAIKIDQT